LPTGFCRAVESHPGRGRDSHSKVSPPFYGNFMTFYAHHRPDHGPVHEALMDLSRLSAIVADSLEDRVEQAGRLVVDCIEAGGKVLACGNGGSAADAQHFVAELVGHMSMERASLPAISLATDPSVVTALANDYGYERLFARQVEGLGQPGDVLLAISTSGRSPNVLRAVETAHERELRTVALVGEGGDPLLTDCDVTIHIPSHNAQRVQEVHMAVLHAICHYVDDKLPSVSSATQSKGGE